MKKQRNLYRWIILFVLGLFLMAVPSVSCKAEARLNATMVNLAVKQTKQLTVYYTREKITWSSENVKIAKVSTTGKITAVAAGSTVIHAQIGETVLSCTVNVVSLNATKVTLGKKGDTYVLKVNNGKDTKWKSSNKTIAKVGSKGKITAVKSGVTTITCTSRGVKMTCKVYIPKLNKKSLSLNLYSGYTLTVSNAGGTPKYSSDAKSIVDVDSKGRCIGVKPGKAKVKAVVDGVTLTCTVTVKSIGGIFTPRSWIASSSKENIKIQKVKAAGGVTRTYTIYNQGSSTNGFKENIKIPIEVEVPVNPENPTNPSNPGEDTNTDTSTGSGSQTTQIVIKNKVYSVKSYIPSHGCAVCSLTTVLSGYAGYTEAPTSTVANLEKQIFGFEKWDINYAKSVSKQMPLSIYGIQKILTSQKIKTKYVRKFGKEDAIATIGKHLLSGRPVVVIAKKGLYANSYHTMVLLGMTSDYKVIVADAANRSDTAARKAAFGNMQRVKLAYIADIVKELHSSTSSIGTNLYFGPSSSSGGYLLVDPR